MNNIVLELKNIHKSFNQGENKIKLLDNANIQLHQGEIIGIIGPSGCGKTSLLQIAGLIDKIDEGEIIIDNAHIQNIDKLKTQMRLKNIGFVYQFHNLLKDFTVIENVMMPLLIENVNRKEAYSKAKEVLEQVGLSHRLNYYPNKLSGGEQQRTAIARAIVHKPKIILADEPTGNLDPETADNVFSILHQVIKSNNLAALIVTHNLELAKKFDKNVTISQGKISNVEDV